MKGVVFKINEIAANERGVIEGDTFSKTLFGTKSITRRKNKNFMRMNFLYLLIVLSLISSISCKSKNEKTLNLDILLCESNKNNRLTDQQVIILTPFEEDGIRYLAQGSVLNSKDTISYSKAKKWWKRLRIVKKSLFSEQELINNHLKGLDLSSLSMVQPLSEDIVNKYFGMYDYVLGFHPELPKNMMTKSYKIYTKTEDVLSFIKNEVVLYNPDVRILIVYNPPKTNILPNSIVLDKTSLFFIRAGEKKQLTATILPIEVSEEKKQIGWESDDETIAQVDSTGLVTALANGHAFIWAHTYNGLAYSCSVEVNIIGSDNTAAQLNDLLVRIRRFDDNATDRLRSILGNNLRVDGAANISNVQQLITDVSNGNNYRVTAVNTNKEGKIISINVRKL